LTAAEIEELPWDRLSDSASDAVVELVHILAGRFTGRIEMECMEGGVRKFRDVRERQPGDLSRRRRSK